MDRLAHNLFILSPCANIAWGDSILPTVCLEERPCLYLVRSIERKPDPASP